MKHLGDITKISGYTAPIVDCIIGGSPCQDLSVAGKRAGLEGERSGLFMDQIRIIKEMRDRDGKNGRTGVNVRPRFMVWENVPGAFSSNKGEDFRVVLEETAHVADKDAVIPQPDKGKWSNAGCIMGEGWSIAWRVLDAQFWGVPQRRRRIALVADFGGHSASEILFVRQSLSGNTEQGKQEREAASSDVTGCTGADDPTVGCDIYNLSLTGDKVCSITAGGYTSTGTCPKVIQKSLGFHCLQDPISSENKTPCLGGGNSCNGQASIGVVYALDRAAYNQGINAQYDFEVSNKGINSPLVAKGPGAVCYGIQGNMVGRADKNGPQGNGINEDVSFTLNTIDRHGVCYTKTYQKTTGPLMSNTHPGGYSGQDAYTDMFVVGQTIQPSGYIVRRLTPLECERLQGFPDGWTDIGEWTDSNGKVKKTSDSARYKALGNSIAIPPWKWVLKRICACYERDATMASLFDGIGGFPYIWEQFNGKGSCLWASEIEEFPIAVTKARIGECT